jgi:HTH-type transcriptional regulator, competence development regulator
MTTGPELRDARQSLGWSLRDAERVSGVPNAHISQIETGKIRRPGLPVLAKLAAAYGRPVDRCPTCGQEIPS